MKIKQKNNSNKPIIQNSITKALLTKEAIASCELDGGTQCGDMTIEPKIKKKIQWTNQEIEDINNIINLSGVIPKKLDFDGVNLKYGDRLYSSILENKLFDWFDIAYIIEIVKQQGISQRTQDILDILEKHYNCKKFHKFEKRINEDKYEIWERSCIAEIIEKIKALDSPQESPKSGDVVKSGQTYCSPTEDTIQSKKEEKKC